MGAGVAVVIALLASQAVAQYTPVPLKLTYSVGLNGDNHVTAWNSGTRQLYSGYSTEAGQSAYNGALVNWSVLVKAEGDHLGKIAGTETNYYRTFGAANLVFNVELHQGTADGPLVTTAEFSSTINDGSGGDPDAAAAFAISFQALSTTYPPGRAIDMLSDNGPRMGPTDPGPKPLYTYPHYDPAEGKLIGMGCGYEDWARAGGTDLALVAVPGVGMDEIPSNVVQNGVGALVPGLGVVPIAEGQIDMSTLPLGTYVLKVIPGKGNNVLRGDMAMKANVNRPAFAIGVPEEQVLGGTLAFTLTDVPPPEPCEGVVGRYVYYNNSKWDGNTPTIGTGDFAAIATDKHALLPGGGTSSFANYISYSKGINGIIVDACDINRVPNDTELYLVTGNTVEDPFNWADTVPWPDYMQVFPGAGVNGSDRLVMAWADNAIPNTRWLLVGLFVGDGSLGLPVDDFFVFGCATGDANGDALVNITDEIYTRNNGHNIANPAPIIDPGDFNRDKLVNITDGLISRNNGRTIANKLKTISW
jgi:hypothetical protein